MMSSTCKTESDPFAVSGRVRDLCRNQAIIRSLAGFDALHNLPSDHLMQLILTRLYSECLHSLLPDVNEIEIRSYCEIILLQRSLHRLPLSRRTNHLPVILRPDFDRHDKPHLVHPPTI